MICLSKFYLDSSVSSDNYNLYIQDYLLVKAYHPGNLKRGGMCVHFKETLPVSLKVECIAFEVSINNKRGYVISIYRSASQMSNDFNLFTTNLEKLVVKISSKNPRMIRGFKGKSSNWSSNDTTTAEGAQLDYLTSLYVMKGVKTEPTHILEVLSSSMDLIFPNQPNLSRILECIQHYIQNVNIK